MRVTLDNPTIRHHPTGPYIRIWSSWCGNITTVLSQDNKANELAISWSDPEALDEFIKALEAIRGDIAENWGHKKQKAS